MKNNTLELPRKIMHMISGIGYILFCKSVGYSPYFILISISLFLASLTGMWLVTRFSWWQNLFRSMMRTENPIKGIGVPMYIGGMFIACSIQYSLNIKTEILIYALVTLAIGDGVASIVGKSILGALRSPSYSKSYSGAIVGVLCSVLVSYLLIRYYEYSVNTGEIFLYTSIGMGIEFILVSKRSHQWCLDNLCIPLGVMAASLIIS